MPPPHQKKLFAINSESELADLPDFDSEEEKQRPSKAGEDTSSPADTGSNDASKKNNKRKVVYNSNLSINVETFDGVDTLVNQLVEKYDGFIANANLDHLQGTRRSGHWQVRVPVENYRAFMSTIGNIGTVVKRNEDALDVTADFYDLEARIKNKKRLEERIVELLAEAKGNLARLIEVEQELARVREEIERMQGRSTFDG